MCLAVLNLAGRNGDPELATSVIHVLSSRRSALSTYHYEALLEAYTNSQDLETALRILTIMYKGGIEPDSSTTRPLYSYLAKSKQLASEAWKILRSMHENGHVIPAGTVNVILESSITHGNIEESMNLYKQLHTICESGPNVETFNVLLRGLKKGMKDTAMFLAAEMKSLHIMPEQLTYDRLVLVCLTEDDYEDAFRYVDEMRSVGTSRGEVWKLRPGTITELIKRCTLDGDERAWKLHKELMRLQKPGGVRLRQWMEDNWNGRLQKAKPPDEVKLNQWSTYE